MTQPTEKLSVLVATELDEAVSLRQELNSVYWKYYNDLSRVFAYIFDAEYRTLKQVSDINYYRGGWPSEKTPPRLDTLVKTFSTVVRYYSEIGRLGEINSLLALHGLHVEVKPTKEKSLLTFNNPFTESADHPVQKHLKNVVDYSGSFAHLKTSKDIIEWFLAQTAVLQKTICDKADRIKIDLYDEVKKKTEGTLPKGAFVSGVNRSAAKKTREEDGKDTAKIVEAVHKKVKTDEVTGEFLTEVITAK